jgi:hypothetical protein
MVLGSNTTVGTVLNLSWFISVVSLLRCAEFVDVLQTSCS